MDLSLSEELEMLRDTARRFAEEHIAPYAQKWDAAAYYPDDIIKKLGDQGFMGILLPEEYGGSAGSVTAFAVAGPAPVRQTRSRRCRACPGRIRTVR